MKIIFMGTPNFACPTLQKLIEDKNFEILAVYSREPQAAGRGQKLLNSPIHDLALKHNIRVITPKSLKDPSIQEEFVNFKADAAVVVAYGLLLPKPILNGTKFGCINIHPSILPKWRGAAPIQRCLMSGDKETGIAIIKMDQGLDSGDVICQEQFILDKKENYKSLSEKLSKMGAEILIKTLKNIRDNKFTLTKQNELLTTYAKKIEKEECLIDWTKSAKEIDQKIRGLSGSIEAYFFYDNEKIKVFSAEFSEDNLENNDLKETRQREVRAGEIINKDFWIKCGHGKIRPISIQRAGKSVVKIDDFLCGFKLEVGKILQN